MSYSRDEVVAKIQAKIDACSRYKQSLLNNKFRYSREYVENEERLKTLLECKRLVENMITIGGTEHES